MRTIDPDAGTVNALLQFLDQVDPAGRRRVDIELAQAGIVAGTRTASDGTAEFAPAPASAADAEKRKKLALTELMVTTLTKVVDRFPPLKQTIQGRVAMVRRLKLISAIITSILSSSVIASLQLSDNKAWNIALGVAALLASLLTLIATWMEGESKVSEEFGEVSAKCEAAEHLRDRLAVYKSDPTLFDDLDERLKEAQALVDFLSDKFARWNVVVTT